MRLGSGLAASCAASEARSDIFGIIDSNIGSAMAVPRPLRNVRRGIGHELLITKVSQTHQLTRLNHFFFKLKPGASTVQLRIADCGLRTADCLGGSGSRPRFTSKLRHHPGLKDVIPWGLLRSRRSLPHFRCARSEKYVHF